MKISKLWSWIMPDTHNPVTGRRYNDTIMIGADGKAINPMNAAIELSAHRRALIDAGDALSKSIENYEFALSAARILDMLEEDGAAAEIREKFWDAINMTRDTWRDTATTQMNTDAGSVDAALQSGRAQAHTRSSTWHTHAYGDTYNNPTA